MAGEVIFGREAEAIVSLKDMMCPSNLLINICASAHRLLALSMEENPYSRLWLLMERLLVGQIAKKNDDCVGIVTTGAVYMLLHNIVKGELFIVDKNGRIAGGTWKSLKQRQKIAD